MSTQSEDQEQEEVVEQDGFDLSVVEAPAEIEEQGTLIKIRGQNSEPLTHGPERKPVTILVAGTYSKLHRNLSHAQTTKTIKRKTTQITGELLARQRLEIIAGCVLAWEGFKKAGVDLPCNRENVKFVLENYPYIMEQVEVAMEDHEAFSAANSSS